jgi:NAD(P)-dependent dehydrogenase (short-subunit alcohol dehydrogenase family)
MTAVARARQPAAGRTVLVTGGSSGIGAAVVGAFSREGCATVSLDLATSDSATFSVVGDVREPEANRRAVAMALSETGRLDVVVANAGIHDGGLGLDVDADVFLDRMRRVVDVDLVAYALIAHASAPELRRSRGRLLFTLSDASFLVGQQGAGIAYTAAKHGALGMLGWLARELAPDVAVNAVAPGGVITDLHEVADGGDRRRFVDPDAASDRIRERNPLRIVLGPADVAEHFRWLASEAARGLTGQVIRPDGGLAVR